MATDWVKLFDLDLAKAVVRMDDAALERFVAERGPGLAERDRQMVRERFTGRSAGTPPVAAKDVERFVDRAIERSAEMWKEFAQLLEEGDDLETVRSEAAWAAGTLSDPLHVDYWGCLAEALSGLDVNRACESNLTLEPHDPDAHVYFLLVPHVDAMIASLRAHWSKVTVMSEAGLHRLMDFRDRCASEPGLRVAYYIDL